MRKDGNFFILILLSVLSIVNPTQTAVKYKKPQARLTAGYGLRLGVSG